MKLSTDGLQTENGAHAAASRSIGLHSFVSREVRQEPDAAGDMYGVRFQFLEHGSYSHQSFNSQAEDHTNSKNKQGDQARMRVAAMQKEEMYVSDYLQQVKSLLIQWVSYKRRWKPDNGLPTAVCWIDEVKGSFDGWTEGQDYDDRIYAAQMRHVDEAVRDLDTDHRHAIAVVYLGEIGPKVWRSARKSMNEIKLLCDAAERMLVTQLRRRDVVV